MASLRQREAPYAELTAKPKVKENKFMRNFWNITLPLFEGEDFSGSGGPTPTPTTPAAATPAAQTPQAPATQGAPTPAPATQGEAMVPSYRLRELRQQYEQSFNQRYSQAETQWQKEREQLQNQLRALVGAAPPQNPEVDQIRNQFGQLYPGLSQLEERAQQLQALLERAGDLEQQNQHYWHNYAQQTTDRLFKAASDSLGGPISDETKRILHNSFVGYVQSSPDLSARYEQDPSIVEDFWKAFSSSFINPAQRTAAAQIAQRAGSIPALPQDSAGGIPNPMAPKLNGLDERVAAAWTQFQQHRNPR